MRALWICGCFLTGCLVHAPRTNATTVDATARLLSVKDGVAEFEIRLTNTGGQSIFVEESLKGSRNLHSVNIEIEGEPGKWTYVGPKRDAAASSVFELRPGQSVSRSISVTNSEKGHLNLLKSTQPKYRARLRYFPSQEAWLSFAKSIGRKSRPVEVIAPGD
jgi:hypothetical protein